MRRWIALVLIACTAGVATGCASVSEREQNRSLAALAIDVPAPRADDSGSTKTDPSCREGHFPSLAPSALPRPGQMAPGTFMRTIHDRGALRVGVDQNSLGLGYFNPNTLPPRMEGFDIELARAVARAIFGDERGHIVYTAISTDQRQSAIVHQEVDLVASAYSISCERLQSVRFSSVYLRAQQKLLVAKDSKIERLSDPRLQHEAICATKGSTSLRRLLKQPGIVADPVDLRSDCLVALQEGEVAAITSDDAILVGLAKQDRRTKIVGGCLHVERYGLAINRSHPDFVRFVNGVLARLRRSGEIARFRRRWLPGLRPPTNAEVARCDRDAS
jgi:polar amino acid transport system substrate-binding protein